MPQSRALNRSYLPPNRPMQTNQVPLLVSLTRKRTMQSPQLHRSCTEMALKFPEVKSFFQSLPPTARQSFRHRLVDVSHGSLWPSGKRLEATPECARCCLPMSPGALRTCAPKNRLFPARSGLTSRLRHRCLWHLRSNKSVDAVGRPSCRSPLLGDPGAKFLPETGDPNRTVKNSLNYVSTCLRVVDTRRSR
jgi:hypothetical protein